MLITLFAAALSFQVSQPAQPEPAVSDAPATAASAEEDKRTVCRRERNVGSNFPVRTCRTVREWREMRDAAEELGRRSEGQGSVRPLEGGM